MKGRGDDADFVLSHVQSADLKRPETAIFGDGRDLGAGSDCSKKQKYYGNAWVHTESMLHGSARDPTIRCRIFRSVGPCVSPLDESNHSR